MDQIYLFEVHHKKNHTEEEDSGSFKENKMDEIDDLVRDLGLTKAKAELLTSRLKEWNLLDSNCKLCTSRKIRQVFSIVLI